MIYQPTASEIAVTLDAALARFPYLGARLDSARAILTAAPVMINIAFDPWRITSMSDPSHSYMVGRAFSVTACTCPDFAKHNPQTPAPLYFCKHILAYHAYRRILVTHLAERIIADYDRPHDRHYAEKIPGSLTVLRNENGCHAVNYPSRSHIPASVCAIRPSLDDSTWVPVNDAQAARLAVWLDTAPHFVRPLSFDQHAVELDRYERIDAAHMRAAYSGHLLDIA